MKPAEGAPKARGGPALKCTDYVRAVRQVQRIDRDLGECSHCDATV
jgi:hypothetical protein